MSETIDTIRFETDTNMYHYVSLPETAEFTLTREGSKAHEFLLHFHSDDVLEHDFNIRDGYFGGDPTVDGYDETLQIDTISHEVYEREQSFVDYVRENITEAFDARVPDDSEHDYPNEVDAVMRIPPDYCIDSAFARAISEDDRVRVGTTTSDAYGTVYLGLVDTHTE